jgi:hypothetical protein
MPLGWRSLSTRVNDVEWPASAQPRPRDLPNGPSSDRATRTIPPVWARGQPGKLCPCLGRLRCGRSCAGQAPTVDRWPSQSTGSTRFEVASIAPARAKRRSSHVNPISNSISSHGKGSASDRSLIPRWTTVNVDPPRSHRTAARTCSLRPCQGVASTAAPIVPVRPAS